MRKIALIGGDSRQIPAAATLTQAGFTPYVYGNDMAAKAGFTAPYTIEETLTGAEAVLLPVPSVKKDGFLYAPLSENTLPLGKVLCALPSSAIVFLWGSEKCRIDNENRVIDLAKNEILQLENAHATAQAALTLALSASGRAFFGTQAAVLGYGRIGKYLSRDLSALGAAVRVGARREESRKEAEKMGFSAFLPTDAGLFSGVDLIFNTIPAPILTEDVLCDVSKNTVFLELASSPGGLSENAAKKHLLKVVMAQGLPGKYCPHSAGQFLAQAVLRHLGEGRSAAW